MGFISGYAVASDCLPLTIKIGIGVFHLTNPLTPTLSTGILNLNNYSSKCDLRSMKAAPAMQINEENTLYGS
jgi:hypothetical protein